VAGRTLSARFRRECRLLPGERVAVGICVAFFAPGLGAAEHPHVTACCHLMTGATLLLRVLASQRQRRARMQCGIKCMRCKMRALVTTDAALFGQGTVIELPAVGILMTSTTVVGSSPRVPFGERSICLVALRAGEFVVRRNEREGRMPVMLSVHHQARIIEVLVVQGMARHAARSWRQTASLGIACHKLRRVRRFMANGTTASFAVDIGLQLLQGTRSTLRVTCATTEATVRPFKRQQATVRSNNAFLERRLRVTGHALQLHLATVRIAVTGRTIAR
jgi:hypothetical protein